MRRLIELRHTAPSNAAQRGAIAVARVDDMGIEVLRRAAALMTDPTKAASHPTPVAIASHRWDAQNPGGGDGSEKVRLIDL